MSFWETITGNPLLNVAVLSWFIAQSCKVITVLVEAKKIDFKRFVSSGGMPSSHSATMTALTVMTCRIYSFASPYFAISFVLSMIVMYDATGVRRAAGKQAAVLNKMMENIGVHNDIEFWGGKLKELIGHTPFQVFVGAILGGVIAMICPIN